MQQMLPHTSFRHEFLNKLLTVSAVHKTQARRFRIISHQECNGCALSLACWSCASTLTLCYAWVSELWLGRPSTSWDLFVSILYPSRKMCDKYLNKYLSHSFTLLPYHAVLSCLSRNEKTTISGTFYGFTIFQTWTSPVIIYLNTGNFVVMLRYGQWLFCTPVSSFFIPCLCATGI